MTSLPIIYGTLAVILYAQYKELTTLDSTADLRCR